MKRLLLLTLLLAFPASAQEQPSHQSQAVSNRLLAEINANITCEGDRLLLLAKIRELETRLPKEEKK